jgi:hypothetical protein
LLHRITNSKVYQLTQLLQNGAVVQHLDKRGKHGNRPNRNSTAAVQSVIDHISSFPAESSRYSRSKNSSGSYLSLILSIGKMYSLYFEECYNRKSHTLISLLTLVTHLIYDLFSHPHLVVLLALRPLSRLIVLLSLLV